MATLSQLVFMVKDTANKGMSSRASEVGDRLIIAWINKYANMLTAQDINRKKAVDQSFEFDLGCLTLTKADVSMCSQYCFGENTYYVCLPALLNVPDNMALTFFGLVDKKSRIPISAYSYGSYSQFNRFSPADRIYGEMINNKVFLHNVDDMFPLQGVNARGVWADVSNLVTDCSATPLACFNKDTSRYPIPESMIAPIMDMIYTKELGITRNAITDKTTDDVTTETG